MKNHSKEHLVYAKGLLHLNYNFFYMFWTLKAFFPPHRIYDMFLQGLLEGVSQAFTKDFHFIDSVKAYLSYALLRASVSQAPVIFQVCTLNNHYFVSHLSETSWYLFLIMHFSCQYAAGIFSVLLLRFRESLKVGIFLISWCLIKLCI